MNRNRRRTSGAMALAAVVLLLAAPAVAPAQASFRLPGLDGGQLTNADLAHGATVIVVWASWSPRCRNIVERVNGLVASLGSRARVVTVDFQEDPAAVREFLAGKTLRAPVFLDGDGEFSKAYAVTTLPGLVVFKDGAVRYQGKLPADPDATIGDALGGG